MLADQSVSTPAGLTILVACTNGTASEDTSELSLLDKPQELKCARRTAIEHASELEYASRLASKDTSELSYDRRPVSEHCNAQF